MGRRTANAIENSRRGKKSEVRKWMLWSSSQETMMLAANIQQQILHDWMRVDNRTMVRQLQMIEDLMVEIIEEENTTTKTQDYLNSNDRIQSEKT